MALKDLPEHLNFPRMEEEVLAFWKEIDAFKTSVRKSEGRPEYTFYDGPPFATGLPHYGHILAGTIKDVVCRYQHQTGHHVRRGFGWDCHGLPIEFEIEKELGIKSSHDVKKFGIANYNNECRKIVMRYSKEWEVIVARVGRWIDFEDGYRTMDLKFMESVWWVFKQLWEKDLVYRGFKVMPFSTACTTPLSNFESNMNYKDVSDPSVIVTFPLVGEPETSLLAWTTTPWTLPSNLALCVNSEFDYVKVRDAKTGHQYILAECRLEELYKDHHKATEKPFTVLAKLKGSELVGKKYVPLFDYFATKMPNAFRVVADKYVSKDSGTGVVHQAPGFGEDDFRVCLANGVINKGETVCPVDENGCFTADVSDFAGKYIKDCDEEIAARIKAAGRLVKKAAVVHSYPFCWRSETPLIYKAVDAWFVKVEQIRDKLLANNDQTSWVPDFVKTKRFSNWLEDAKDWNVSRNRYWGTPLPVWVSEDMEEMVCVGSVAELEALSGKTGITDIHREFVDVITIPSKREGKPPLRRIDQVFDCWFESGSMPYAQSHYPFENKEHFEKNFPADFIAEGLDQTRGWFYTLLVLSTALFEKPPYKNLIVNGLVLAEDGKKMSKRLKNYPEPTKVVDEHGADALRLYLINSPVVRAEPLRFREAGVKDVVKDVLLPFMNATKFFLANAKHFLLENKIDVHVRSTNDMDRWILAATQTLVQYVHKEMDGYRLYTVVPGVLKFVEKLTNWYVRMNRRRLKGATSHEDWHMSLSTLFQVLYTVSRVLAPYTPFVAETIYQCIRGLVDEKEREDSVHYLMIPEVDASLFDDTLEASMDAMTTIIDLVRVLRDRVKISMKKPLKQVVVCHTDAAYIKNLEPLAHYICHEVNCFELKFTADEGQYVVTKLDANMATLGKRLGKSGPAARKAILEMKPDEVQALIKNGKGTVGGFELTMEDVKVQRTFREGIENFESNTDGNVVVLVDTTMDEAMVDSWKAREFVNRVQMLRKKAKLVISDAVDVYFHTPDPELAASILKCREQVSATVKGTWATKDAMPADAAQVAFEENEIAESPLEIYFVKPKASHKDPEAK